jgi:hypothetical protein
VTGFTPTGNVRVGKKVYSKDTVDERGGEGFICELQADKEAEIVRESLILRIRRVKPERLTNEQLVAIADIAGDEESQ